MSEQRKKQTSTTDFYDPYGCQDEVDFTQLVFAATVVVCVAILVTISIANIHRSMTQRAKRFEVHDSIGNVYHGMKFVSGGDGFAKFEDGDGRMLILMGNLSYREEGE